VKNFISENGDDGFYREGDEEDVEREKTDDGELTALRTEIGGGHAAGITSA
jgi:hypothetical protein